MNQSRAPLPTPEVRTAPDGLARRRGGVGNAAMAERLGLARPVGVPHRGEMEARFGESLGDLPTFLGVANLDAWLGTDAATDGETLAFSEPAPSREVVAHEIAHVMQARHGAGPRDPEAEAADAETAFSDGGEIEISARPGAGIQGHGGVCRQDVPMSEDASVRTPAGPNPMLANPPARYASLPDDLGRLLVASLPQLRMYQREFRGQPDQPSLWAWLDLLATANLQTLIQVRAGAQHLGIWALFDQIRSIYTGTSWGVEWVGERGPLASRVAGSTEFCQDPAWAEGRFHPMPSTWWRHLEGAIGQRGMHVGVDAGVGFHNLHWDSSNPASHRDGGPVRDDPEHPMAEPDQAECSYNGVAWASHAVDIGIGGQSRSFPQPYAQIDMLGYVSHRLRAAVDAEVDDPRRGERAQLRPVAGVLARVEDGATTLRADARPLAVREGQEERPGRPTPPEVAALRERLDGLVAQLLPAMHTFAAYLAGAPGTGPWHRSIEAARTVDWDDVTTHLADDLYAARAERPATVPPGDEPAMDRAAEHWRSRV